MKSLPVWIGLMGLSLLLCGAGPSSAPVEHRTLLNGQVQYDSPAGWAFSQKHAAQDSAVFVSEDRHGGMTLNVQPEGMTPSDIIAVAILKKIREERAKPGVKVIQQAKIEHDPNFEIRISEAYEEDKNVYSKLYLYRQRGKRTLSVTVTALNPADDDAKRAILHAGEEVLLSVKWTKK